LGFVAEFNQSVKKPDGKPSGFFAFKIRGMAGRFSAEFDIFDGWVFSFG
jgi:hypothetical protein